MLIEVNTLETLLFSQRNPALCVSDGE